MAVEEPMEPGRPLPVIAADTALARLMPSAPAWGDTPVYVGDELSRVPDLRLEAAPDAPMSAGQWQRRKGHAVAAALHLNAKEEDGYLKALLASRPDLKGVPFVMGGACRTRGARAASFKEAAELVVQSQVEALAGTLTSVKAAGHGQGLAAEAHLAAVRQIAGPRDGAGGLAAVQCLAGIPLAEATRSLARVAVFSQDRAVREAALAALSVRRERDYTAVLAEALRYPWPAVARNAADAIVALKREDMLPHLANALEAPDPRAPRTEGNALVACELVRINHHHNCLLCHAPAAKGREPETTFVAEMPLPTQPLQPPSTGYGRTESPLLVRIDVTYLRQDFSALLPVADAGVWPESQRFDFVVRKRELSPDEADDLRKRLEGREQGVLSPYQEAAVAALRKLTGRDFEARAEVWRAHLKLKGS
jgi:hypothetical protein